MLYTRREIGKLALAVPAAGLLADSSGLRAATKPNSKWSGVQVGMNVPYNFGSTPVLTGDEILQKCIDLNVSGVELRAQPVEAFLGLPANLVPARGRGTPAPDPAVQKANAEELRKWRVGVPMSKVQEFRKKWNIAAPERWMDGSGTEDAIRFFPHARSQKDKVALKYTLSASARDDLEFY